MLRRTQALFLALLGMIIVFYLAGTVSAVSIQGDNRHVTFHLGETHSFSYIISGADRIEAYVDGNMPKLHEMAAVYDDAPGTSGREIEVKLNFNQEIPPGNYKVFVGAREMADQNAPIGGITAIQAVIFVKVLFPGKYVKASFGMPNANVNEQVAISIPIENYGTLDVDRISGQIMIYDENGNLLKTIQTNTISLASDSTGFLKATFSTADMTRGNYRAVLAVTYDGAVLEPLTATFMVGAAELSITNYTSEFPRDSVNKLDVMLASSWNGKFTDVYALISINGTLLQTPSKTMDEFGIETLSTYWENRGLGYGTYPGTITVFFTYADQNGAEETGKIVQEASFTITPEKEPRDERPDWLKARFNFTLTTTTVLYLLVALIILIDAVYIWRKKSSSKGNSGNSGNSGNAGSFAQRAASATPAVPAAPSAPRAPTSAPSSRASGMQSPSSVPPPSPPQRKR